MKQKKIILLVILQAILLVSQAQVQVIEDDRPIWQTGKIYLKIKDNSEDIQPIEQKIDNYISIYPNPSKGIINVDYSVPDGFSSTLVFYDVNGRKISSYNLESNSKCICLNDKTIFSEGVYYYSLIIGNEVVARDKLVLIK